MFVESIEGVGTTVTIVFPIYETQNEPTEKIITPEGEEVTDQEL